MGDFPQRPRWLPLLVAVVLGGTSPPASAQTYTWTGPYAGNWSTPTNWSSAPGGVPNAPGATALFDGSTSGSHHARVDGSFTVGRLTFANLPNFDLSWTAIGDSLTVDNGASASVIELLPNANGSNATVSVPALTVAGNNVLNLNATDTATIQPGLRILSTIAGSGAEVNINPAGQRGTVSLDPYPTGNTYGGAASRTTVSGGRLIAVDGRGLPTDSALHLSNAVWEVPTSMTLTRTLGDATGGHNIQFTGAEAGLAVARGATLTVRLNNGTDTVTWGSPTFNPGVLFLGSFDGSSGVVFENGIDLNGADRTVKVDRFIDLNPTGQRITGAISNSTGTAGLTVDGGGVLILTGANTYNGQTTVAYGTLRALDGRGLPTTSNLNLAGVAATARYGVFESIGDMTLTRSLGTGPGQVQFTNDSGALSAHDGTLTVRLDGGAGTIAWGAPGFVGDSETLRFGSRSFTGVVDFQNGLDLGGQVRRIAATAPGTDVKRGLVRMSGVIDNGGVSVSAGVGGVEFTAVNTYTGQTGINSGALRAVQGVGLPNASNLVLSAGGVYEGIGPTMFTRALGAGAEQVRFISSGGFSASGGPMTVRLNNGTDTLTWGSSSFVNFRLDFGSRTADSLTDFQNGIDLAGQVRSFDVQDNPTTAGDIARISGVLSNGGVTKGSGRGTLELTAANTYAQQTTVQGGALRANHGTGLPAASNLLLDGGVLEGAGPVVFTRELGTAAGKVQFGSQGGGFSASGGPMTVRLNNGTAPVTVASGNFTGDVLKFGSATADDVVEFQNGINLSSGLTVFATRNPGYSGVVGRLSGVISNTGGLVLNSARTTDDGTLELTAANTYSGGTSVSQGRLLVNNATGSGTGTGGVYVGGSLSGGLVALGGSGRIAPAAGRGVTLDRARIEPGWGSDTSLRIETTGGGDAAITIGYPFVPTGATWAVRVLSAGTGGVAANSGGSTAGTIPDPTNHTFLDLSGGGANTVRIAPNTLFEVDGTGAEFTLGQRYSYGIGRAAAASEIQGGPLTFTDQSRFTAIGFQGTDFSVTSDAGGVIYLNFTPVPEPSTVLLVAATGLGLSAGGRRLLRRGR